MTITAEDRLVRKQGVGSSDIAAIASPAPVGGARQAIDVYLEKLGLVDEFAGNDMTDLGEYLEPWIGGKYSEAIGVRLREERTKVHPNLDWVLGSPDFLWEDGSRGVEVKNVGKHMARFWFDEHDGYPEHVLVQCTWLMHVFEKERWDVSALLAGRPPVRIYHLDYDHELADLLLAVGRQFWFEHVKKMQPPAYDASVASRAVSALYPTHGDTLRPATDREQMLCRSRAALKDDLKRLADELGEVDRSIKEAIAQNAGLTWPGGKATWKQKVRNGTDWKRLALDLGATPKQIAAYETEGSRVLNVRLTGEDK